MPSWITFVSIGIAGGLAAGIFGIGGGIIIVPALVYWAGFSQHMATGTTLAVFDKPIVLIWPSRTNRVKPCPHQNTRSGQDRAIRIMAYARQPIGRLCQ